MACPSVSCCHPGKRQERGSHSPEGAEHGACQAPVLGGQRKEGVRPGCNAASRKKEEVRKVGSVLGLDPTQTLDSRSVSVGVPSAIDPPSPPGSGGSIL